MKLHAIGALNLASLYGEHRVDLDRDLGGAPLFLIVGPTGAGKSTLLDAISLALFGHTPRLTGKRGESDAEVGHILSRGTGACLAEVEFSKVELSQVEAPGEGGPGPLRRRYRARWSCRRAHGRPDGTLQAPERSLERWDGAGAPTPGEDDGWTLLVSDHRQKEIDPVFTEVLESMTSEDFQRSVLLAQGAFAAFLTASEDERASILERLTSTERYRELGLRAQERWRASRDGIARLEQQLEGLELPDEEELAALRRQLAEGRRRADRLGAAAEGLEAWESWGSGLLERLRRLEAAAGAVARAEGDRSAAEKDLVRLREDRRHQPAEEALRAVVDAEAAAGTERQLLRREERQERVALAALAEAGARRLALWRARRTAGEAALEGAEERLAELRQDLAEGVEAVAAAAAARKAAEEGLAARLEPAETPAAARRRLGAQRDLSLDRRGALERALQVEGERAAARRDREEVAAERVAVAASLERDGERQEVAAKNLEERQRTLRALRDHLDTLKTRRGFAEHRRALTAGSECPLCGAVEHPYCEGEGVETALEGKLRQVLADLEAQEEAVREAGEAAAEARAAVAAGREAGSGLETRRADLDRRLAHLDGQLRELLDRGGWEADEEGGERRSLEAPGPAVQPGLWEEPWEDAREDARQEAPAEAPPTLDGEAVAARMEDLDRQRQALDHRAAELDAAEEALVRAREAWSEAEKAATDRRSAVALQEDRLVQYRERLEEVTGQLAEVEAQVEAERGEIGPDGARPVVEIEVEDPQGQPLKERSREADRAHGEAVRELEASRVRLAALRQRLAERARDLEEAEEALALQLEELEIADRDTLARSLLGAEERQRLTALEGQLDSALHKARGGLDAARADLADHRGASPRDPQDLRSSLAALRAPGGGAEDDAAEDGAAEDDAAEGPLLPEPPDLAPLPVLGEELLAPTAARLDPRALGELVLEAERRLDPLTGSRRAVTEAHRQALQEVARREARLDELEGRRKRQGRLLERLREARERHGLWEELRQLIGKEGGKEFKKFAQILNLQDLIDRANHHLALLAERYRLVAARGGDGVPSLAFAVRDAHMAGIERPLTTLSGGETFLVSLALALGLAGTRETGMPIETLLLDEGFGTLDARSLDTVMATLERLYAEGSTQVGLISHVEALRERIEAQILVEPQGNGRSAVRVRGGGAAPGLPAAATGPS